jgi:hypothetical protein
MPPVTEKQATQQRDSQPRAIALRPRKRWFIILSIVMAVWIGALVTMYFTTVWPQRHSSTPPREKDVDDHRPTTMNG